MSGEAANGGANFQALINPAASAASCGFPVATVADYIPSELSGPG